MDWWSTLSRADLRCPSVHHCPDEPTGSPLYWYCLRRRKAGWSTLPRLENSPHPLFFLKKSSQPRSFASSTPLAMYSPISSGIAVRWGRGRLARALLLQGVIISSTFSPSGRGGVWNVFWIDWGGTGSEIFALLSSHQPPPPSSSTGDASAAASNLKGGPWGGVATLCGLPPPPHFDGLCVPKTGPRTMASFSTTASPLLPQDDLHDLCHEILVSSWGVWNVILRPPTSRLSLDLDVVWEAGLFRCVPRGQG